MIPYFTTNPQTVLLSDLEKQYEHDKRLVEGKEVPTKYQGANELRSHAIRKVIIDKMKNLDAAVAIPLQLHTAATERKNPS